MGDFTGNMASTNVSRNPDTVLCTADLLNRAVELLNGRSNVLQQERTALRETLTERTIGEPEQQQIFNAFLVDFNPVCKNSEQVVEMGEQEPKRC